MSKGPSWAPSSGVGYIPGFGTPTPGDMIHQALEDAELAKQAAVKGTTLQINKADIPRSKLAFTISDKITKDK